MFMQLSVFVGGGTLDAAEATCNPESVSSTDVLESIALLIGKNLLKDERSGASEERRLTMLETIREYALEQLRVSGSELDAWRRHADYYLQFAERAGPVYEPDEGEWLDRLESEHDNLRAALGRLLDGLKVRLRFSMVRIEHKSL